MATRARSDAAMAPALGQLAGLAPQGATAPARDAYQRSLAIDEAAFGPDHPEVATNVNNLGMVLHDLGDLPSARDAYQRPFARHLHKADDEGYYDRSDCQGHNNPGKEKI